MTNAPSIYLVDTNVLVYLYDQAEPAKREKATRVYRHLLEQGTGALTVQVLGEFFNVVTRRLKPPLSAEDAFDLVIDLQRAWTVLDIQSQFVVDAMRAVRDYRISYYDALIWATAKHCGIPFLLSEDLNAGQIIEGVQIINPFAPEFDLAVLS